jgi:MoaA/NifB/PqqE/SkfB family radical SAM enzyme
MASGRMRCRHAFEYACVHANGEVVCSIIDGRGDFVLGNVHDQSLTEILTSERAAELRRLMRATGDSYCSAIGKHCPLKNIPADDDSAVPVRLRFLAIEPTTACDLRCLACPIRDFAGDTTWRDAYKDGGVSFLAWDAARRTKQHAATFLRRALPSLESKAAAPLGRTAAVLLRGRARNSRSGTLPIDVLKRVVTEAGPEVERVDFYNYGEPFLYKHLLQALRHIRDVMPKAVVVISTDGMQVRQQIEEAIVGEGLLDWVVFSIDGCDAESYRRYRIRGKFDVAFQNLERFHRRAIGTGVQVVWQYVVFRWNDRDDQLKRAIDIARERGMTLWFDFAHSWGHSRRNPADLQFVVPYLRPFTPLPGQPRQGGW